MARFHERHVDLWSAPAPVPICILTNGCVTSDASGRRLIMGAGCAKQAAERIPGLPGWLGRIVLARGNVVHFFGSCWDELEDRARYIITFPTKHDYRGPSLPSLIEASAHQLMDVIEAHGLSRVYLPRPGCGHGGLSWEEEVRPLLLPILDHRVTVVDFPTGG